MFKIRYILALFLLVTGKVSGQSADMNKIFNRTRALLLSDTAYATEQSYRLTDDVKYDTDAKGYFARLGADGSWPDINYHSEERSAWKPSWHMYRVMLLIREYHKNNNAKYLDAIHRTLKFWIANDFLCSNWWQNQIDMPYAYSSVMLMLDKDALTSELDFLNNVLVKRSLQKAPTGQNKIWQHDIDARIALIHRDEAAFAAAMKNMQSVITVGIKEGIQPDYSFQQHGPMLQFGNYGLHFINSLLFWMTVSAKTNFAFEADKQTMLFDYCSKGIRWSVYKGAMDNTAIGRQFRQNAAAKRGQTLLTDFNLLKTFDNADACKYALDGLTDDCTINGTKAFWRTDYLVQLKGNHYMMSVKTHGPGVSKVESINSENLKGAFLNDGVTQVQQTGKEYQDIQPLWNWTMLPGTTCDTTVDPHSPEVFKTSNTGLFTGLVSDGVDGASAMDYNRLGIKAKKAYFMVDGMLVCLGAGIESLDKKNVVTTVEQRYSNGALLDITNPKTGDNALWNNNTAYVALSKATKLISQTKIQSGAWNKIDGASAATVMADSVFTVYIGHNTSNTYAYAIKPEITIEGISDLRKHLSVLKNTVAIQAVQSKNAVMAVFYQPGILKINNLQITTDKPCMVIYKKVSGKTQFWISDPTRTLATLTLTVNGKAKTVNLPQGDLLGSTVRVDKIIN